MEKEMLRITLTIANRSYQLNIKREEEEIFREAAKAIEEGLNIYSNKYKFAEDKEETCLSMFMLDLAVRYYKLKRSKDIEPIIDKINQLNQELTEYLDI